MTDKEKFKTLLDESYTWPSIYPFKFIIKPTQKIEIETLFPDFGLSFKESKTGKYISVSFDITATSSQDIIDIYEKVTVIENIIRL
ncbi:MAG: DUF493 family protein [Candidatus Sericytochromatia bacterium]